MNHNKQEIKYDYAKVVHEKTLTLMTTIAERLYNPLHYHLSKEAKKRLRWIYILYDEQKNNVTRAANKIGISRQWLSHIKSIFENNNKDPRNLEPESKVPYNTSKRKRIPQETEQLIVKIRKNYPWGKVIIARILKRDYQIIIHPNTVNKYLHKHKLINPKLSLKNFNAMKNKKQREQKNIIFKVKYRPPTKIKDYAPGALIEKDMKYIAKLGSKSEKNTRDNFYYQQTMIDSFTRIRVLGLTKSFDSQTTAQIRKEMIKRFPFNLACENTDNGAENIGEYTDSLQDENVFHFYSNSGTPTDNPRVERSHLTDDIEFYNQGNYYDSFEKQKEALEKWEYVYNFVRPHQAIGYLTPMEFYALWKKNPNQAYEIVEQWQVYLRKQRKRLNEARRIKRKNQINALMTFIDIKLNRKKGLNQAKLQLQDCQLCSVA